MRLACDNLCTLAGSFPTWGRAFRGAESADAVARHVSVEHRTAAVQRLRWAESRLYT